MSADTSLQGKLKKKTTKAGILLVLIVLGLLLTAAAALIQPVRSQGRAALSLVMALFDSPNVKRTNQKPLTNILFLHHSTGELIITQGGLREQLSAYDYSFWDHGYNWQGLRGPDGKARGYSYRIPSDNTDPDWLAVLFDQKPYSQPLNAYSGLMQHEVIVFKSCFTPTSHITSDEQLAVYKSYYRSIRDTIDQHPNKLFILMTQPPLNPAETNADEATRARALSDWLVSDEFLEGRSNLTAFNSFNFLIDDNPNAASYNMLRTEYRNGGDSHPNQKANEEIAPQLADFIHQSIQNFRATQ